MILHPRLRRENFRHEVGFKIYYTHARFVNRNRFSLFRFTLFLLFFRARVQEPTAVYMLRPPSRNFLFALSMGKLRK